MAEDLSQVESEETPQPRELLPLPLAIRELAPTSRWSLVGEELTGLVWEDDPTTRPSDEDIIAKAREIKAQAPLALLRRQRDARMREVDWVTLRAVRTGEAIPQEWKDYMQALADITETATPSIVAGVLVGVTWPTRPDGKPAGAAYRT